MSRNDGVPNPHVAGSAILSCFERLEGLFGVSLKLPQGPLAAPMNIGPINSHKAVDAYHPYVDITSQLISVNGDSQFYYC